MAAFTKEAGPRRPERVAWLWRLNAVGGRDFLTSMDRDGTASGFDAIDEGGRRLCSIPVIALVSRNETILSMSFATARRRALAASIFHYGVEKLTDLRSDRLEGFR